VQLACDRRCRREADCGAAAAGHALAWARRERARAARATVSWASVGHMSPWGGGGRVGNGRERAGRRGRGIDKRWPPSPRGSRLGCRRSYQIAGTARPLACGCSSSRSGGETPRVDQRWLAAECEPAPPAELERAEAANGGARFLHNRRRCRGSCPVRLGKGLHAG
jgi:hypothetical protein